MDTSDPAAAAGSMAEVLLARAAQTPDDLAFCFLIDGENEGPRLTYADLDRAARAVAVALRDAAEPGDRALLVFAPGLDFVAAFFGCQYAGVVPVPVYPPRPDRLVRDWQALANIAADCGPRAVLADGMVAPFLPSAAAAPALAAARRIVTAGLDPSLAGRWRPPPADPDALALLQYTSGTTAAPKGVMVTHRNLMHNQELIHTALVHSGPGGGVCWLPPYHDMGLVGGVLQIVYHGAWGALMSPVAFLQKPVRWLRAISRYRADTSGGPGFAYDLCVQRSTPEERAALDLRMWSVAGVGAEPVDARALERFAAAFAPAGFDRRAFYPGYGLAEATLMVTGGPKGAGPRVCALAAAELERGRAVEVAPDDPGARPLVGCGRAWAGQEVRVADPDARTPRPDGHVGEIWVRGPSVAKGYWGRPDLTAETFRATLAESGDGPYLRTGDLGFLRDGELFVTGRLKDLIIVRGRNHAPHDIEETVQSAHPALKPGCGAAFEFARDGRPGVVVVQEVDRRARGLVPAGITGDVRQAVAERHDLQVLDLVLIEPGSIPKTTSGKVRRAACRQEYERDTLRRWKERTA